MPETLSPFFGSAAEIPWIVRLPSSRTTGQRHGGRCSSTQSARHPSILGHPVVVSCAYCGTVHVYADYHAIVHSYGNGSYFVPSMNDPRRLLTPRRRHVLVLVTRAERSWMD